MNRKQSGMLRRFRQGCMAASILLSPSALAVSSAFGGEAWGAGRPQSLIQFDIPAQPLADAVSTFSAVAGIEVLVPGELLARRRSSSVSGRLTPEAGLRALLLDTGLAPRATGDGTLTLVSISSPPVPIGRIPRYQQYSAALQTAVTNALCHAGALKPGGYRIAARLWVGQEGEVTRAALLGTTGDTDRDLQLGELLKRVIVGEPPPAQLRQPTTILVLPRFEPDCMPATGRAP